MKNIILIIVLSCVAGSVSAEPMTERDMLYEGLFMMVNFVDWGQTRYIADNPHKYYETNPVIGKHPRSKSVDRYFAISMVGHLAVTAMLNKKWRRRWQTWTIYVASACIISNRHIGIMIKW